MKTEDIHILETAMIFEKPEARKYLHKFILLAKENKENTEEAKVLWNNYCKFRN